jgi:hypothetical protein
MYYIVNAGSAYQGAPNLDAATGRLTLPTGQTLEQGHRDGWRTITIKSGEISTARKAVTERAATKRAPTTPPRPERARRTR